MTDLRPAEVVKWTAEEVSRIRAAYGDAIVVTASGSGDALLIVSDPAAHGWTGTARLLEVRRDAQAVEFTVFFSATPPSKRRPAVHLWGLDVRDDGQRVSVSIDTPWTEIGSDDDPALRGGIERLVRGDFRPPLPYIRARRLVTRYGE